MSWNLLLILPPVTFLILLAFVIFELRCFSKLSFKSQGENKGKLKSYACGEDCYNAAVKPDYSQFFSYAYFFTIMHVVALVVSTIPASSVATTIFAIAYLLVAASAVFILFRR